MLIDCWPSKDGVYVPGAGTANDAKTLDECQLECMKLSLCVGVNWFPGGLSEFNCYINAMTPEAETYHTSKWSMSQKTVFYELNRTCSGESRSFYRAMLCVRGTSHGPVFVCVCLSVSVSVTSRSSAKTIKVSIKVE